MLVLLSGMAVSSYAQAKPKTLKELIAEEKAQKAAEKAAQEEEKAREEAEKAKREEAKAKRDAAVAAGDKTLAQTNLTTAIAAIDKAAAKGIFHKNNAARKVSRLQRAVNTMA